VTDYENFPRMNCEDLKQLLDADERPIIVDTRDSRAYRSGHIPGAINVSYSAAADPMEWQMMLASLPGGKLTVIYCD